MRRMRQLKNWTAVRVECVAGIGDVLGARLRSIGVRTALALNARAKRLRTEEKFCRWMKRRIRANAGQAAMAYKTLRARLRGRRCKVKRKRNGGGKRYRGARKNRKRKRSGDRAVKNRSPKYAPVTSIRKIRRHSKREFAANLKEGVSRNDDRRISKEKRRAYYTNPPSSVSSSREKSNESSTSGNPSGDYRSAVSRGTRHKSRSEVVRFDEAPFEMRAKLPPRKRHRQEEITDYEVYDDKEDKETEVERDEEACYRSVPDVTSYSMNYRSEVEFEPAKPSHRTPHKHSLSTVTRIQQRRRSSDKSPRSPRAKVTNHTTSVRVNMKRRQSTGAGSGSSSGGPKRSLRTLSSSYYLLLV